MTPRAAIAVAAMAALGVAPAAAHAGDIDLLRAHAGEYRAAERAAPGVGSPQGTQASYDRARDLQERLRAAGSAQRCDALLRALRAYAAARVLQAEGVDRLSPGDERTGRARATRLRGPVARARAACNPAAGRRSAPPTPVNPVSGQAFLGTVVARAPAGARSAVIVSDRGARVHVPVRRGRARAPVGDWPAGRHDIRIRFLAGSRTLGAVRVRDAWLLPPGSAAMRPGAAVVPALTGALRRALDGAPRFAAAWAQDLATGRVGHTNAAAAFPAASTVKLGLAVGVMARLGGAPQRSRHAYDLRAMLTWSSNLANNRLLRAFGARAATDGLRRLGARSSTFTGEYIVGTEFQPRPTAGSVTLAPPRVSARVTTVADLARMMASLHGAAVGAPGRRPTGLTANQARLLLGWLLASQQRMENTGLFAGGMPRGTLFAQKNGWLNDARLGAAIAYTPAGPLLLVLATYDPAGVSPARGRAVGARVARAAARAR